MNGNDEMFGVGSRSLLSLFSEANVIFKIPNYQRPYRWKSEQVEQLWEDIYNAYVNNKEGNTDKNYFLGSVITTKKENSLLFNIIDGQQRVTTLSILFAIIARFVEKYNSEENITVNNECEYNYDDEDEEELLISAKLIDDCIHTGSRYKLRFKPNAKGSADFRNVIDAKTIKEIEEYKIDRKKMQIGDVGSLYYNAAQIFIRNINESIKNVEELNNFNKYLFNNVKMIHIQCHDESFAIKMFQIINNRGLALYSSDLIKSSLYQQDPEQEENIDSYWSNIEDEIKKIDDMTIDDMFTVYLYAKTGENPKKSLDKEILDYYETNQYSPTKAMQDFNDFVEAYNKVFGTNECKDYNIYALKYIPWQMYFKAIVTSAIYRNYPHCEELFKALAQFYYLNFIAGKTLTQIKQASFNIIKKVNDEAPISEVYSVISKQLDDFQILPLFKNNLLFENVFDTSWLKPLLMWIEYNEYEKNSKDFIPLNRAVQIEHILPQEWEKNWSDVFTKDEAKTYVNSLGNLTLLSGNKNIKATNKAFSDKIDVYNGYGLEEKCTTYRITQHIYEKYRDSWAVENINKRKYWLLKRIVKLFSNILLKELK